MPRGRAWWDALADECRAPPLFAVWETARDGKIVLRECFYEMRLAGQYAAELRAQGRAAVALVEP